MHRILIAALALAAPAAAQTAPQPQAAPAAAGPEVPRTELSNQPVPSNGPRAQQAARSPGNNASVDANAMVLARPVATVPAGAAVQFQPSVSPSEAFPPPPAQASYPVCKGNQYDKCMEPGPRQSKSRRR